MRSHLLAAYDQTGRSPELLTNMPQKPYFLDYLWIWFVELHSKRKTGMNGHEPIGYSDIYHWAQLTKSHPAPWEIRSIMQIDDEFMKTQTVK